jgi:hypothetical protein
MHVFHGDKDWSPWNTCIVMISYWSLVMMSYHFLPSLLPWNTCIVMISYCSLVMMSYRSLQSLSPWNKCIDNSSWLENNSWSWQCICSMAIKMVKNDNSSWLENSSWSWQCMCSMAKIGGELTFSGMVGSFCSTSITRRVTIVTNPVSEERTGKCLQQVEHVPWR